MIVIIFVITFVIFVITFAFAKAFNLTVLSIALLNHNILPSFWEELWNQFNVVRWFPITKYFKIVLDFFPRVDRPGKFGNFSKKCKIWWNWKNYSILTSGQKIQKESAKNLGIRLTPGLLDMTTSFQYGGGLLKFRNAPMEWKLYSLFIIGANKINRDSSGIKKMTFFLSLNRNTARNYRNEAKYLGIFSRQKQLQRKGFGGNMERRRKQHTKKSNNNKIETNVEK